jgi:catechol 2,3-dioxygenase-like lactoylglutathione lyase family enzyme
MKISRATPVLFVDDVEASRDFFKRLGFEVLVEIPEDERVGFSLLQKDDVQLMVETRGNANEPPALRALSRESRLAVVFVEVDDLDAVIGALSDAKIAVERHTTFYHADEITYEEPGGNLVTFAKMDRPAP